MDNKLPETTGTNSFDEAPASVTVKIKSPTGFEYMFTMRNDKASTLMFRMKAMEKIWTDTGFTPLAQNAFSKGQQKPVEYVADRVCPTDSGKLIKAKKKDGTPFIKCENNKYINGQQTGCKFVEWSQTRQPSNSDYDY